MEVRAPIIDGAARRIGDLVVSQLPGRKDGLGQEASVPWVVEGAVYRFVVELDAAPGAVTLEPSDELFSFDTAERLAGRFMPRQHVGRVRIAIVPDDESPSGVAELEVTATKLEYATEYQHMLGDVAEIATEALLQGFAPAALSLQHDPAKRPKLLYQQFAFLHARLQSRAMRDALALISAAPHRAWVTEIEWVSAGRPLPRSSSLSRALARPGPRVRTNGRLRAATVPQTMTRHRTDATFDSVPNRFVKYALLRWRSLAHEMLERVGEPRPGAPGPVRRGRRVAEDVIADLNGLLAAPFFADVGQLDVFPAGNQVLHKQEGYRQVFQTFALTEVGAALSLDWDIDDAFSASQRNVATLYEYWAFLQLVRTLGQVCGQDRTVDALAATSDGLALGFKQGAKHGVRWRAQRGGRDLEIEVFFNRSFGTSSTSSSDSSWSRAMRPDCSVVIRPATRLPDVTAGALDVWLHFDAKYRVDRVREQFDSQSPEAAAAAAEAETAELVGRSKREDLLKMHAYRDAIRRSAGAYVLFPGNEHVAPFRQFEELLPGIGAFVLRPTDGSSAVGSEALAGFLDAVLDHVADQASQHERDRYWHSVIRASPVRARDVDRMLPPLSRPPDDTAVIVVRSPADLDWIRLTGTLVVGCDPASGALAPGIDLRAEWVLVQVGVDEPSLWWREGSWWVQTGEDLTEAGYAGPSTTTHLTTQVAAAGEQPGWLADLPRSAGEAGRISTTTWADLLAS